MERSISFEMSSLNSHQVGNELLHSCFLSSDMGKNRLWCPPAGLVKLNVNMVSIPSDPGIWGFGAVIQDDEGVVLTAT